jgi:hypothetical protein
VRFSYTSAPPTDDKSDNQPHTNPAVGENDGLRAIERDLRNEVDKHGPLPSWLGSLGISVRPSNLWLVKGVPWLEVSPSN